MAVDPNLVVPTKIEKEDIRFYNVLEAPFEVRGVFYEDGKFRRLPEAVAKTVSGGVTKLHSHTAGRFHGDNIGSTLSSLVTTGSGARVGIFHFSTASCHRKHHGQSEEQAKYFGQFLHSFSPVHMS